MTRITQIQFSQESGARSALRLQHLFRENNLESTVVSLHSGMPDTPLNRQLGGKARLTARLDDRIRGVCIRYNQKDFGLYSYPLLGTDISGCREVREADVIYVHWVMGGFMNLRGIRKLLELKKPVFYFLHDMWAFTGGCHYSFNCEKYISGCEKCQMFQEKQRPDFAAMLFRKKQKLLSGYPNLYFVAPSRWIYNCAVRSELLKDRKVFLVPNTFDVTVYKPIDKAEAKRLLNIEKGKRVVAFGAISIDSPYKGWKYLAEALNLLKTDPAYADVLVLVFGSGYDRRIADDIPFNIKFLGYLRDELSAAIVYNAADVFIAPSLADVGPATVQESLACGTPVAGFNTGGIPDMIEHKMNGYIAEYRNSVDLCSGIKYCLGSGIAGYMLPGFHPSATMQKHLEMINLIQGGIKN